ncbi:MAG: RNA methyltransferase [Kiritimatiellae bacterium]|nr:RNA methyltransferase [Kiritimatiellia bacterium]
MSLENIRIVLVSPIYGGNVGSVCRAMANMGFSDLAIAAPRPLDMNEARMMACHASDILDRCQMFPTLAEAVHDCGAVVGTTARGGLYRAHVRPPRELAPVILDIADSAKVALVFGSEVNGLTNDDLAFCTHLLRIPSRPEYPSLNVAQAVLICCYELFVAHGSYTAPREKSDIAPSELRERMFAMWRDMLITVGFMNEEKADHMMLGVRRIFSRGALTEDDVRILMGVARQAKWAAIREPRSSQSGAASHSDARHQGTSVTESRLTSREKK